MSLALEWFFNKMPRCLSEIKTTSGRLYYSGSMHRFTLHLSMNSMSIKSLLAAAFALLALTSLAEANLVVSVGTYGTTGATNGNPFVQNGVFEGHVANDAVTFSGGGNTVVLTTAEVGPSGFLNEGFDQNGFIGVNASGIDGATRFDDEEFWSFSFDTAGTFTDFDFGRFEDDNEETFTVSSSSLGTLTFIDNGSQDQFSGVDSENLNFATIVIPANEIITLAFTSDNTVSGDAATARLEGFIFTAVPEPGSGILFATSLFFFVRRSRRRDSPK